MLTRADDASGQTLVPQVRPSRSKAIVVLGMHRSGTSALTGALGLLGGSLPSSLMPATRDNPKGYFESTDLAKLHDDLLSAAGTEWYSHERVARAWLGSAEGLAFADRIREAVLQNYPERSLFLVKDPRVSRLFPLWEDVLGQLDAEPNVIISVRNPAEVARSLLAREDLSITHSHLVWLRHMLDAERDTRSVKRTIVHYEELLEDWRAVLARATRQLAIEFPRDPKDWGGQIDSFLTQELRRNQANASESEHHSEINGWIQSVSRAYQTLQQDPESSGAMEALDAVAEEFDRASAVLAPAFTTARTRCKQAEAAMALAARQEQRLHELEERSQLVDVLQASLLSEQQRSGALAGQLSGVTTDRDAGWLDLVVARQALAAAEWELNTEREFSQAITKDAEQLRADLLDAQRDLAEAVAREQDLASRSVDEARLAGARIAALRSRVQDLVTEARTEREARQGRSLFRRAATKPSSADTVAFQARAAAVRASGLFDAEWYYTTYPDVEFSGEDALKHFVLHGDREGRSPGPGFDAPAYLTSHPEARENGALAHFMATAR